MYEMLSWWKLQQETGGNKSRETHWWYYLARVVRAAYILHIWIAVFSLPLLQDVVSLLHGDQVWQAIPQSTKLRTIDGSSPFHQKHKQTNKQTVIRRLKPGKTKLCGYQAVERFGKRMRQWTEQLGLFKPNINGRVNLKPTGSISNCIAPLALI